MQWWVPQRIHPASAIEPPGLPWSAVGWGLVAFVVTTVVGSAIPAIVAARLDVATAPGLNLTETRSLAILCQEGSRS